MKFIIIVEPGIRVEAKTQGRRPSVVAWLLGKKGRVNSPAQVRQFAQTITTFERYQKCRNVPRLAQSVKKHWLEAERVQGLKGYQPYERSHTPQKGWWGSECVNDKGYFFVKWKFYLCENLIDVFLCFMGSTCRFKHDLLRFFIISMFPSERFLVISIDCHNIMKPESSVKWSYINEIKF